MKSASQELVKSALSDGWKFEILAEGYDLCKDSTDYATIIEHIESVDCVVEVHIQKEGEKDDWCNILVGDVDPDEEIVDCYVNGYIDKWCAETDFGQNMEEK
jgi:hypothetical protein